MIDTLNCLYGAALDPLLWPEALDKMSNLTGGFGATALSIGSRTSVLSASASLQEVIFDYEHNEWWKHDALREHGRKIGPINGVYTHHDIVSRDTLDRHAFFQDFWRQHGVGGMSSFAVNVEPNRILTIAVQRRAAFGEFERDQITALRVIGPHAIRALAMAAKLAEANARSHDLETFLARFDIATILVDRKGKVRALNSLAHALVDDAITISRGSLRAMAPSCQNVVDAALSAAFDTSVDAPKRWALRRPNGGSPLVLHAFRVPRRADSALVDLAADDVGVVTLTETQVPGGGNPISALRALGLTPAEARIAAKLGAGATTAETADQSGITVGTVRIHLKSIFGKLGMSSQSDLVRLVARLTILR